MYDFHVHTCFSYDGSVPLSAWVSEAQEKGLQGICFTDHMEMFHNMPEWATPLDIPAYRAAFEAEKARSPIPLFFGMELGMQAGFAKGAAAKAAEGAFDFVIASLHLFNGRDPYYEDLSLEMDRESIIDLMISETMAALEDLECFSVLGHLDYIFKHHPAKPRALDYAEAPEKLDALLLSLIQKGKGIEVNTSGYGHTGSSMPGRSIVKRYRELGGEIVTLGSDSHRAGELGRDFRETMDMLAASGFRYYTYFQHMEPYFLPIK